MKKLKIGMISGILNQLQDPSQTICGRKNYLINDYLDLNSWFWSDQLSNSRIEECLSKLDFQEIDVPIKVQWAVHKPLSFLKMFEYAKKNVGRDTCAPQTLYSQLEILQIACELLYYTDTSPFRLDIGSGFIRSADSSKELRENCIKRYANPYFAFIQDNVMPIIESYKPEVLWLYGRPNAVNFAISMLAKKINPDIYIGIAYHSSEYYSLNKLLPTLIYNKDLFRVFDIIILHDDLSTMSLVEEALEKKKSLSFVPNIIYSPDRGKTIIKTNIGQPHLGIKTENILDEHPISIRLFPEKHCYWGKCNFCGINKKYLTNTKEWNYNFAFKLLKTLNNQGIHKLWFIDEALPGGVLEKISNTILSEHWEFEWHVRTRIEPDLLNEELIHKLYTAGLKNILFGFESASERILQLMNKTLDYQAYLEMAECIVKQYNSVGISVHFPAIIGFPTESKKERKRTIRFLEYLRKNYRLFSYNINILELDISSELYKNHAKYNISTLHYPCPPYSFLGNSVKWGICDTNDLEEIQNLTMRYQFPWFPKDSFLNIATFYKLLEHTRTPFWGKALYSKEKKNILVSKISLVSIGNDICCFKNNENETILFNENTLNYIKGGDFLQSIFLIKNWTLCEELLQQFSKEYEKALLDLLQSLVDYKILNVRR